MGANLINISNFQEVLRGKWAGQSRLFRAVSHELKQNKSNS